MTPRVVVHQRPTGVLRLLLRVPRWLYRLHGGWLLGHRFLLLTHRGRRTGHVFQSVLEVARYDFKDQESIVISGWGDKADWYRNLQASPPLRVETAGRSYSPEVRFLSPQQTYAELQRYIRGNPWAGPIVRRLFGLRFDASDAAREAQINALRGVGFRPASEHAS